MILFKRICAKCEQEFETIQKKETPLCHLCQHDIDELESMDRHAEEVYRDDRASELDGWYGKDE